MTWSPNASFATELADRQKAPLFAVEFSGLTTVYTTGEVTSPTWTTKQILRVDTVDPGYLDVRSNQLVLGEIQFTLVDRDSAVLDLLSTEKSSPTLDTLGFVEVTLHMGFVGLAQSSWEQIGKYQVTGVTIGNYGAATFRAVQIMAELANPLFSSLESGAKTTISAVAGTTLTVRKNEDFAASDTVAIVREDSGELVWLATVDSTSVDEDENEYIDVTAVTMIEASPKVDDRIVKAYWLEGNPVNIAMRVMLDDFATSGTVQTNWPLDTAQGAFATDDGLGIASAEFDTTQIQGERDTYMSELDGRLVITKRQGSGFQFMGQFGKGLGWFYQQRDGTIGFRGAHLPIAGATTPDDLNTDNATDWTWDRRYVDMVNRVSVEGDSVDGESQQLAQVSDSDSETDSGVREIVVSSPWLWSDKNGAVLSEIVAGRFLARFARGHQVVTARQHLTEMTVEPGDVVAITNANLPDTASGTAMSSVIGEVISSAPNFASRSLAVEAWLYAGKRTGTITPESQNDFGSATDSEKAQYAFICQEDGFMADGTPGYVIV